MGNQERETLEVDVLFIGAGVANLTAAYKLKKDVELYNEKAKSEGKKTIDDPVFLIIDKGKSVGSHTLSGAVVDPISFKELFPEIKEEDLPFLAKVENESVFHFFSKGQIKVPEIFLPKEMHNKGCYLASIGQISRWLAKKCEEEGIEIYTEFAVNELIREGDKIVGAKIADKRLDKEGKPAEGYTPGMDVFAKAVVIGEGTKGFIAQRLIKEFGLDKDSNPQVWGLGMKELIEISAGRIKKGTVYHTMGYPLDFKTYGGSFIYALSDTLISIGLVFGLDYHDAMLNSHDKFLEFKYHPFVAELIKGGKVKEYGAKTIPEGGYFSLPKLAVNGAVLVGDSAGFLNCMRLKGIHLAMKSGMLAADKLLQALVSGNFNADSLDYKTDFENSWAGEELRRSKNFRQGFHGGMIPGMILTGLHMFTGGKIPGGRKTIPPDYKSLNKVSSSEKSVQGKKIKTDAELYLDLESDVFLSGAIHREEQAAHCHILDAKVCEQCREEYFMPCTRFCPAKVYEEKIDSNGKFEGIHVSFSNCVHCKTCEIKDPYQNVEWHPPEGGDGPKYQNM